MQYIVSLTDIFTHFSEVISQTITVDNFLVKNPQLLPTEHKFQYKKSDARFFVLTPEMTCVGSPFVFCT